MNYLLLVGFCFFASLLLVTFDFKRTSLCLFNHKKLYIMKTIIQMSFLFLFVVVSCNTIEPPSKQTLVLELKDVSCTEAWLQLTTNNIQLPVTINLLKNNTPAQFFNLNTKDSILYIDSLLPNQNYKFKIVANTTNNPQPTTNEILAQTMDTTSHNFTWQTFEFGQHSSSILYDVAIIDENNIWAVGKIYTNDSLGNPDLIHYNAMHWGGSAWVLKKIMFYAICGQQTKTPYTAKSIWPIDENDIWIGSDGDQIARISNGVETSIFCLPSYLSMSINKLWGNINKDLHMAGNNGGIARLSGSNWQKINSGTSLTLTDIFGNDKGDVYASGLSIAQGKGIVIKTSNGFAWQTLADGDIISSAQIFKPKLYGSISSIWADQSNTLYAAGNLLYRYKFGKWNYVKSLPENFIGGNPNTYYRGFINKVRGKASNDMWIVGDRNTVRHFNGVTWQQIGMPYDSQIDLVWRGMTIKDNLIVLVGSHNNKAIVMVIK